MWEKPAQLASEVVCGAVEEKHGRFFSRWATDEWCWDRGSPYRNERIKQDPWLTPATKVKSRSNERLKCEGQKEALEEHKIIPVCAFPVEGGLRGAPAWTLLSDVWLLLPWALQYWWLSDQDFGRAGFTVSVQWRAQGPLGCGMSAPLLSDPNLGGFLTSWADL